MKPKYSRLGAVCALAAIALTVSMSSTATAQTDGSWSQTTVNGNWSNLANWAGPPAAVPGGAGSTINIGANIGAARTVTIDTTSRTVGILNIGDTDRTNNYTLSASGGGTLIFDNGASAAALNAVATSLADIISAPIVLGSTQNGILNISNNYTPPSGNTTDRTLTLSGGITSGSALARTINFSGATIRGNISLTGGITQGTTSTIAVTKAGVNTLSISGTHSYSGGFTMDAGTLNLNSATALGGASGGVFTINGGTVGSTATAGVTISGNNLQSWAGDFTFGGTRNLNLGTGAVTLTGNRVITLNGTAPVTGTPPPTITIGGAISGATYSLTTQTSGTNASGGILLKLNGANTYGGGTFINGGTLEFGLNAVPSAGTISIGSRGALSVAGAFATLDSIVTSERVATTSSGAAALTANSSEAFSPTTLAANSTLSLGAAFGSAVTYTGTINRASGGYFVGGGGGSIEFSAANTFTGTTTLTVGNGGGGTTIISNSNTFDGVVSVGAGASLSLRNNGALGTSAGGVDVAIGGNVDLNGGVVIGEALTIRGTNSTVSPSNITGGLTSSAGSNEWTGAVSATVTSGNNVRLGANGGNLKVSGNVSLATSGGSATGQSLVLTGDGGTGEVSGVISGNTLTTAIIKNGASTWTLSGANTFTGAVRLDDGVTVVSSIGSATTAGNLGQTGTSIGFGESTTTGTLRYTGSGETSARAISLRSSSTGGGIIEQAGGGTLEFTGAVGNTIATTKTLTLTGSTSGTGKLSGVISGAINLSKTGTGTWEISNASTVTPNTFVGTTTVSQGRLVASGGLNTTTALTVSGGATFALGASDVVNNAAGVTLAGGTLAMAGFTESFGALTLSAGASILNLSGGESIVTFGPSSALAWTGSLSVLGWSSMGGTERVDFTGGLTTAQLAAITFNNPEGFAPGIYTSRLDGIQVVPDALIPEPSAILLLAAGSVGVAFRRRRI